MFLSTHLYQSELSPPLAKESSRLSPHETAAGVPSMTPPRSSQPLQALPFHHLCHMWLFWPLTKQSSRFAAHAAAPTPEVSTPPKSSQPLHRQRNQSS